MYDYSVKVFHSSLLCGYSLPPGQIPAKGLVNGKNVRQKNVIIFSLSKSTSQWEGLSILLTFLSPQAQWGGTLGKFLACLECASAQSEIKLAYDSF